MYQAQSLPTRRSPSGCIRTVASLADDLVVADWILGSARGRQRGEETSDGSVEAGYVATSSRARC